MNYSAGNPSLSESSVFASATILTRGAFGTYGIHFRLDLFHRHWFAWECAELADDVEKILPGRFRFDFAFDQPREILRFKHTHRFGFRGHFRRQIQLNRDAHTALVAEGYRSESPERLIHTDTYPTFVPRAGKTKHLRDFEVKPGGVR